MTTTDQSPSPAEVELSPRERGFVARIMAKYPGGRFQDKDLYRSVVIFSLIIVVGHLVERYTPWWLALLIIYPLAIWMFTRYRRFSIFRSCVLSKVAGRLSQYEPIAPPGRPPQHGSASTPAGDAPAHRGAGPGH